jgi:hypothetical protein
VVEQPLQHLLEQQHLQEVEDKNNINYDRNNL